MTTAQTGTIDKKNQAYPLNNLTFTKAFHFDYNKGRFDYNRFLKPLQFCIIKITEI